jgi:hypothetical protein
MGLLHHARSRPRVRVVDRAARRQRDVNAPDGVDSVITLKKTLEKQPRLARVSASRAPANASVTRARAHKQYAEPRRARTTARDGGDGAHG